MNRRKFITRTFTGTLGMGALGGLYSWRVEPFWLEFVHRSLPIKNLPDKLVGKTLMQISDIHVGNEFDYQFLIRSFQKAQALNPDIVVYTGDYVSYENEQQFEQLEEVLLHRVQGQLGTVGILGNHDYGHSWSQQSVADQIASQLNQADIALLKNQQAEIEGLNILGFDDYWGLNFSPKPLMQSIDGSKAHIVLCHNPDVCDLDVWSGYEGWILSGHTHGGQFKPPFLPPPILPVANKQYTAGEIDLEDGRKLYINRALGNIWHLRFNVRPEITVFELQRG